MADLQRKLKDSEQRSTLWARRAGAAEARVPVQATTSRLPLPKGAYPQVHGPRSAPAAKTGLRSNPEGLVGSQVGLMGKPGNAIGSPTEVMGSAYIKAGRAPAQQQGMPVAGQQGCDEEDHEEGCAVALLQDALSEAPVEAAINMHKRRATTYDDSGTRDGARHLETDEPVLMQSVNLASSAGQLSGLQQRIAEYEKQHGLATVQKPVPVQLHDIDDGLLNGSDDQESPLKQRIAEYILNADHLVCKGLGRASSPTFSSQLDSTYRTKLNI